MPVLAPVTKILRGVALIARVNTGRKLMRIRNNINGNCPIGFILFVGVLGGWCGGGPVVGRGCFHLPPVVLPEPHRHKPITDTKRRHQPNASQTNQS
jgi:hypothetical protein